MKQHTARRRAVALAPVAFALSALGVTAQAQAQSFRVTLDTSSLATQMGNLDFQFNPAMSNTPNAALQISGFTTTGALTGTTADTGGGTGSLPGTLTLANSGVYNDAFQGITFGSTLSFLATFSGPALSPPPGTTSGSVFAFSLYDASGVNPLLGTNVDGSVLDISVNPDGTQTVTSGSTALTVTAAPVPESSTTLSLGLLLALGVGGLAVTRRKRASA